MNSPSPMETREPSRKGRMTDITSPWRAALIFAASVFMVELAIMFTFFLLPPLPPLFEALTDSTALVILLFPIIYFFLTNPLTIALSERNKTLEENLALNRTLSDRVAERTQELELANANNLRRATQFEVLARIARTISSTQEMGALLPLITEVVSNQFGLYHVGIYLNDARGEFSELVVANGEAGARMVSEKYRLKIGQAGIVGYVAAAGMPRRVSNTGADAAFFNNPRLPESQSQVALPLRLGEKIFGVLDVQSTDVNAFSQEDIYILSTLADQIMVAIENARLFEQNRQALAQAESIHQRYVEQSWRQYAGQKRLAGFDFDGKETRALGQAAIQGAAGPAQDQDNALAIPLTVGGQTIGTLSVRPQNQDRRLTPEERDLLAGVAERAALSLENARLLEDAQRRAARERAIGELTSKIGARTRLDSILQTTVQELGRQIHNAEISFEINPEQEDATI